MYTRFLQKKGKGRHNRWIGDGSGARSGYGGLYVFHVLAYVTFGGGKVFGQVFADKSEVETWSSGEKSEVMVAVQVDTMGLKADQWRYWTMLDLVESEWILLENGEGGGMDVAGG